jgi:hypothetical protein
MHGSVGILGQARGDLGGELHRAGLGKAQIAAAFADWLIIRSEIDQVAAPIANITTSLRDALAPRVIA